MNQLPYEFPSQLERAIADFVWHAPTKDTTSYVRVIGIRGGIRA
ncbi:hypothetical protein ACFLU8_04505 [Chloroflexota bacterium]